MSSRLMPPNTGAMRTTVSTISSAVVTSRQIGKASTPAKFLKRSALPSITGQGAGRADVAEAEHGGAVGDDGDRVLLDRELVGQRRLLLDRRADPGHARRVGHRQVVAVVDRHAGEDLDLAALVHLEGAVGDLEHLDAVEGRAPTPTTCSMCSSDEQLTMHVLVEVGAPDVEAADGGDVAAGLADGGGEAAERAGTVVEPDPQADGEGGGGGGHGVSTGPAEPGRPDRLPSDRRYTAPRDRASQAA